MSHFFDDARGWLAAALLLLVVLLLVAPMTVAAATVNDRAEEGSYVAAVLEFCPYLANSTRVEREEALYIMRRNMASWDVHMSTANKQGANIFVTPEMGICGFAFNTREEVRTGAESKSQSFCVLPLCVCCDADCEATRMHRSTHT